MRVVWPMLLGGVLLLGGCSRERAHRMLEADSTRVAQRDAGYTLLLDLLGDESRVDGILLIKSLPKPVAELVRAIADESQAAVGRLTDVLGQPPVVTPGNDGLPLVEVEARSRIRQWTTMALLSGRGPELERALLISQLQAVDSIRALCEALIDQEASELRRTVLGEVLAGFSSLRSRIWAQLGAAAA
ncbi:MAG: hypothetical protein VX641_02610 [Planctomycetota bacterium]|nr:hypothetical protein [Planctomycetota bacterium]